MAQPFAWGDKLPTLHAGGVALRWLEDGDIPALYEVFGDPEVARYWSRDAFTSIAEASRLLAEIRDCFAQRRLFQWGITDAETGRVIGTSTLLHLEAAHRRCEVGFALARARWGRGEASQAVGRVVQFAFEELGLHRVEADADPRNVRSLRLLEGLGFKREGLLRERYHVNGELQDAAFLGLLRRDWLAPARGHEESAR